MSRRKLLQYLELREHGVLHGRRQLDRLEADGKFPKRVAVGANRVGWVAAEVDAWVNAAIASREQSPGKLGSYRGRDSRVGKVSTTATSST